MNEQRDIEKKVPISCKSCGGNVVRKEWTIPVEGGMCQVGTYEYYECSSCSMRYTSKEVSNGA